MSNATARAGIQAGAGTTRTIGGQTYTMARSTKNIQQKWGDWFSSRVRAAVLETAAEYRKQARKLRKDIENWQKEAVVDVDIGALASPETAEGPSPQRQAELNALIEDANKEASFLEFEARAVVRDFDERKGAGEYEYHGNASLEKGMQNLPGQFYLAFLCLQPHHPQITLEEVIEAYKGHAREWSDFILESEGVSPKNAPGAAAASTTTSTPHETTSTMKTSTTSPTPQTAALP